MRAAAQDVAKLQVKMLQVSTTMLEHGIGRAIFIDTSLPHPTCETRELQAVKVHGPVFAASHVLVVFVQM